METDDGASGVQVTAQAVLVSLTVSAVSLALGVSWAGASEGLPADPQWRILRDAGPVGSADGSDRAVLLAQVPAEGEEDLYDVTPPVSTAVAAPLPNAEEWNSTDVTVTITAADEESGIRETRYSLGGAQSGGAAIYSGVASFVISSEGVTTVTYSAQDNADNQEGDRSLMIRIDKTPPQVALDCPATAFLRTAAAAVVNVTDALSGVASQTAANGSALLDTSTVGARTFAVTAQDRAGNTGSETCGYHVVYDFASAGGFRPPLVAPPAVNAVTAGRTVPVTWQMTDGAGGFVSDLAVVRNVVVQRVQCAEVGAANPAEIQGAVTGGSSVVHYDTAANQFICQFRTEASMQGNCYTLTVSLDDGTEHSVHFAVR